MRTADVSPRVNGVYVPSFPSPSPHFHFLALVSFLARPKPRIPFLGLSLLRNQTETLAIGNSLALSQMSNPSCSLVNAIAQAKEMPAPILTQFPFSIFANVF